MKKLLFALAFGLLAATAHAGTITITMTTGVGTVCAVPCTKTFTETAFMAKAIATLQQQRNGAADAQASAEARASLLADEVTKLTARVKELETKYEPKAKEEPK